MKKNVLYVSDLDGTLLDSKKRITPYTAEVLNRCIQKGMKFAVATGPYALWMRLSSAGNSDGYAGNCNERCIFI